MLQRPSFCLFFSAMLLLLHGSLVVGAPTKGTITLVSSLDTKESMYGRWLKLIYQDAFARLGYDFIYAGYPGGRAPHMAESGEVDGEIHRATEYQLQTRHLLKVPESHFTLSYEAYAAIPGIQLKGWSSLLGTSYRVEYRRGAKLPELALSQVVAPAQLFDISTVDQGMGKLLKGRSDLYIEQTMVARQAIAALITRSEAGTRIYSAGIMDTLDSYVYLHEKHKNLVAQLALVIRQMKQEGAIARYQQQALQESTPWQPAWPLSGR